jgi:signal transduction histidine kinase
VGQLLTSIVHEVQQPLVSIHLNATAGLAALEAQRPSKLESLGRVLRDINGGTSAAIEIIDRLRKLARKKQLERKPVDLNDVVNEVMALARADAVRRDITLRAELTPGLPSVAADKVALEQVMLDLIVNAMEAIEGSSVAREIVVRTRPSGSAVEFSVSDTGQGITAANRRSLFEAFFTTKADGVGMGLAIAHSIVTAHDGEIWYEDRGGGGATFRVSLPLRTTEKS